MNLPEINLDDPIKPGFTSTFADQKKFCEMEALEYWQSGCTLSDNPYNENSCPHKWFKDKFMEIENS